MVRNVSTFDIRSQPIGLTKGVCIIVTVGVLVEALGELLIIIILLHQDSTGQALIFLVVILSFAFELEISNIFVSLGNFINNLFILFKNQFALMIFTFISSIISF